MVKTQSLNSSSTKVDPNIFSGEKRVPEFICLHENASITTQILGEALKTLDSYDIFPLSHKAKPFLMLDGHKSWLELPFLPNTKTPIVQWIVYIGVPYGTAFWQVGDDKEWNGSFTIVMYRAKKEML